MCDNHSFDVSRRGLLGLGAAAASTAFAGGFVLPGRALAEETPAAPNDIGPDEAMKRLNDGNARYVSNTPANADFSAGRAARAGAQYPFAGLLSCADSRVSPELVFDQGPGELFVMRVAGNFVDVSGLASIEFGVAALGIPLLVVLGHSNCGAISATIDVIENGTELPGHLPELVNALKPGVEMALAEKPANPLDAATRQNVLYNVEKLKAATPIVADAVAAGRVKVVGGVYDIATGKVEFL
ncbi:carbonic anhydrase [Stappia sp. ES.058]|uniref:carbonic anhydrase n=1 Tax=Stappia sp. ES.058 TaxID=1881061 RepID=UPI00087BBE76|nr:carbonic anhydrase [Stappia sp. ES.058]SDU07243.1 carbonic anhydrase [Stappia sp. ES.058]